MGAMMFNSASKQRWRGSIFKTNYFVLCLIIIKIWHFSNSVGQQHPTDEDKGEADAEGQDVTTERLVVFPITLCKHTQPWIDVVLTQSLESQQLQFNH